MKKNNISGFAMIELMISMGLIALVLLSLLIYQISMIKNSFQMNLKMVAHNQLINFSEMLLVNTNDSQRNAALSLWNKTNASVLPQGEGELAEITEHACDIKVNWFSRKVETESIVVFC